MRFVKAATTVLRVKIRSSSSYFCVHSNARACETIRKLFGTYCVDFTSRPDVDRENLCNNYRKILGGGGEECDARDAPH